MLDPKIKLAMSTPQGEPSAITPSDLSSRPGAQGRRTRRAGTEGLEVDRRQEQRGAAGGSAGLWLTRISEKPAASRHELLKFNRYLLKAIPVQASRGCPYRCSFCEIPVFYEGSYRTRPIRDIVEEIKRSMRVTGFRHLQFIDDQITGKHKFAQELFRALKPLNI